MKIDLLSLFPKYFESPLQQSMMARALQRGILEVQSHDIRDWAEGKHRRVDDRPYGGGPGMVMMPGPVVQAIRAVRESRSCVIALSPQGEPLTAGLCRELSSIDHLILLCGHYEGFDERILKLEVDRQISVGDYVLTNGCPAALVLLDAVVRLIPGVLGHEEASTQDSFESILLEGPQYTRPETFEGLTVPEVLRTGNHQEIARWKHQQSLTRTQERRPDLIEKYERDKKG